MAFSTKREYNTSHAMSPSVQASRGAGSAPSSSASVPAASGNSSNDTAALAGMGAVGAGLLGKFAYDKSKQDLQDQATAQAYLDANKTNPLQSSTLTDNQGNVLGSHAEGYDLMTAPQGTAFNSVKDMSGNDVPVDQSYGIRLEPDSIPQADTSFGKVMGNVPSTIYNGVSDWWKNLNLFGGSNV